MRDDNAPRRAPNFFIQRFFDAYAEGWSTPIRTWPESLADAWLRDLPCSETVH